jgi:hypothetical protein
LSGPRQHDCGDCIRGVLDSEEMLVDVRGLGIYKHL